VSAASAAGKSPSLDKIGEDRQNGNPVKIVKLYKVIVKAFWPIAP
jgi:hypothetical protein